MLVDELGGDFDPGRLRLARWSAGLSVKDLAARVDVTPAAISQFEHGHHQPRPAVVARLALATGVGITFFRRGRTVGSGSEEAHFRSLRSVSRGDRNSAYAISEMALDVAQALTRHVRLPPVTVPTVVLDEEARFDEIERAASVLRNAWDLPRGPVGNVLRTLESRGVVTVRYSALAEGIDAFSVSGERPVVVIDRERAADRIRFDAAHELGHLVCHAEPAPGSAVHERQANAFAAAFLMPADDIRGELPDRWNTSTYAALKRRWGVSIQALVRRAFTLDVIGEAAYRRAMVLIGRNGWRTQEPVAIEDREWPVLLAKALDVAEELGYGLTEMLADTGLPGEIVRALLSGDGRPEVRL